MSSELKLTRVPINTHCADPNCHRALPFGAWAYWHLESETAICPDCGVKRGWSSKERANQIIKELELREDIKALRKQRKIEADALHLLKEQIDLHRLGEHDLDLEKQIVAMTNLVQDYLKKCGTEEEKQILRNVCTVIRETQELQKELREQIQSRLFLLERDEQKRKKKGLLPMPLEIPEDE